MDLRLTARAWVALAAALVAAAAAAPPAPAQAGGAPAVAPPPSTTTISPRIPYGQAIRIARTDPKVAQTREKYGRLSATAEEKPGIWQVGFFAGGVERAQVIVDAATGEIRESWTGYQVAWQMARGYPGQFGHKLNAPYVWIPLALVFFLGLFDFRRPWRAAHLDLLALLGFGVSEAFFNAAEIGVSVPLAYPFLLYLLARMLMVGFRRGLGGLRPSAPARWLAIATIFLLGFRVALNIADSGVIDVGYAGVIGADRITHGERIYDNFPSDNPSGDTYGPANYYAYVPFELALPWSGSWDNLPAAHAAAIFFDLACVAGLFVLGTRLRAGPDGRRLGTVMAFAWAAYPYTDYALQSNANDALLAALVIWALVLFARPLARGALLGLAAMTKFAPIALAPLLATGERSLLARPSRRAVALFAAGLAAAIGLMLIEPALSPGLRTFWHRTIGSQIDRDSPFSVWGQADLGPLHTIVQGFAGALALLVAFLPRWRDASQIAALAAAVTIATELTAEHWFYLYIPWFFPLVVIALAARAAEPVALPELGAEPLAAQPAPA